MTNENRKEAGAANLPAKTTQDGGMFLDANRFEFGVRVAKMLAGSDMLPDHFQGSPGNIMIALNLADRFGTDPFMTMQNIYIVHGKPGLEAKLAIALINQCGKFTPLQYRLEGEGESRKCTAHAKHISSGEKLEQTVTFAMARKEGWVDKPLSKWKTMPDLMLQYRSAMFFARLFCPEVLLGMHTREELQDFVTLEASQDGTYESPTPVDDLTAKIKAEAPSAAHGETIIEPEEEKRFNCLECSLLFTEAEMIDGTCVECVAAAKLPPPVDIVQPYEEALNRKIWKNMRAGSPERGTGYAGWIFSVKGHVDAAAKDGWAFGMKLLFEKWVGLYPDTPWPWDVTDSDPDEDAKRRALREEANNLPGPVQNGNGEVTPNPLDELKASRHDVIRYGQSHPEALKQARKAKGIQSEAGSMSMDECLVILEEVAALIELESQYGNMDKY